MKHKRPRDTFACSVIDTLGGNQAVAAIFGIHHASVSEWRAAGIPPQRAMYLRLSNPDVFDRFDNKNAEPREIERAKRRKRG